MSPLSLSFLSYYYHHHYLLPTPPLHLSSYVSRSKKELLQQQRDESRKLHDANIVRYHKRFRIAAGKSEAPSESRVPSFKPSESSEVTSFTFSSKTQKPKSSKAPSAAPSLTPSEEPSSKPSESSQPSTEPSSLPSFEPSTEPSSVPSFVPSPSSQKTVLLEQYYVACGRSYVGGYVACRTQSRAKYESENYNVRCCKDGSGVGWYQGSTTKNRGDRCSSNVYARSLDLDSRGICFPKATHDGAVAFCASVGGRLCTREELLDDCTAFTGCAFDKRYIWSSTEAN